MKRANSSALDPAKTRALVAEAFESSIVPTLIDYIRIPNKSPLFDAGWHQHGHMDKAVELLSGWAQAHVPAGASLEVVRLPGRTPVILIEVPATAEATGDDTVVLYGHLDKQPEMAGWDEDKGPWIPLRIGDRLYGRGGADDGYAIFASLTAINAVRAQGAQHARCVVLIEACEESGSHDLPYYIEHLADRIGSPTLVICLDSGCGDYDRLWLTTSLRGVVSGELRVEVLREGVHSGDASGIVPSSFRIIRQLLDRLEDSTTGCVVPQDLYVEIPTERVEQAAKVAEILGNRIYENFPLVAGMRPADSDCAELFLNRTWRPALSVTGVAGIPPVDNAGNVLRPFTALKLSVRIPPTLDVNVAIARIKALLEADPPYGATVSFNGFEGGGGWNAPALAPWLMNALDQASGTHFGQEVAYRGEGGSIPFMGMLGKSFPHAQFMITGVLGPHSNAHGPNEFLHLPTAERLTACVADIIAVHSARNG